MVNRKDRNVGEIYCVPLLNVLSKVTYREAEKNCEFCQSVHLLTPLLSPVRV